VSDRPVTNEAALAVRKGPLVGPVLGRVVGMLAARAQCPIDRLDDAMLLTDAVAAHAPAHTADAHVRVTVAAGDGAIELRVRALSQDGANALLADADLPGVGNVFQRVADDVDARSAGDDEHGELVLRLRFAAA
jgi:serine/threonine-protein kinase RsbW